jgi:hypothetical protein
VVVKPRFHLAENLSCREKNFFASSRLVRCARAAEFFFSAVPPKNPRRTTPTQGRASTSAHAPDFFNAQT